MFIRVITVDLYKLFEDCCPASGALHSKASGVVEMTIDLSRMFIVAILRTKDCRTDRASKVFDVKFHVC